MATPNTQEILNLELIRLADKVLFEHYVSEQLKIDLILKTFPAAVELYITNCPTPPTIDDIITEAKKLKDYISEVNLDDDE